ncbi:protein ImuB [Altererythrobacter atlanticus]|uniref:DNA polymerase IV n=1 Tax=Croceibacterium atlanticum TaxID=1267766 RepID=A0A0F7KVJ6_9SPHN|nr:DNA polymerase Y family protein [Croceibacterium atlanticum]AKH43257.1 DNA polymerase IV [Croceibacterium atlanticum]MBB5732037.1 protein ImuB [Croceibacterium atlanticum]
MTEPALATRRYLALWFPQLPADRWCRTHGGKPADTPTVFVEKHGGAVRIAALDAQAQRLGLAPGLTLADARARIPELVAIEYDPHADRLWLERIADGCDRWTPMVELDPPDGITLDITGCAHLAGGEAALALEIERCCAAAGLGLRHAFAGTPEAAQALARFQTVPAADERQAVRRLSIAALRLEEETERALRYAGLKTLGDLAARPSAPLAARFGTEMMARLDRLLGHTDSRISPRRAPPVLIFERRFAEPIARIEDVLAVLDGLVGEAAGMLEERHEGGRQFVARLYRSDGAVREIMIETGQPTRDPAITGRLFRERIDTLADPIDPGFGFDLVRLAVPTTEPLGSLQLGLEGGGISEEAMAALIDRLSSRLGRDRIRRFARRDTHVPEQQAFTLPAVERSDPVPWPVPPRGEPPLRPLHLFDPPQPVEVLAEVPDGPPRSFRWRSTLHEVKRFEGPERIAGEWWRVPIERLPEPEAGVVRKRAGKDEGEKHLPPPRRPLLTRDYFRVEDARGRRFWLFRHGLYERETGNPAWYIHGLFA